jgi:hypothetical protein
MTSLFAEPSGRYQLFSISGKPNGLVALIFGKRHIVKKL